MVIFLRLETGGIISLESRRPRQIEVIGGRGSLIAVW